MLTQIPMPPPSSRFLLLPSRPLLALGGAGALPSGGIQLAKGMRGELVRVYSHFVCDEGHGGSFELVVCRLV